MRLFRGWVQHQRVVFLLVSLLLLIFGVWQEYQRVYLFHWSDEEKRNYQEKSLQSIQFRENAFDRAIQLIQSKKADFSTQTGDERDIFGAGSIHTAP